MFVFVILMLAAAVTIMYKTADIEHRNASLWGAVTLLVCIGCMFVIPWPFINVFVGLVVCFGAMFVLKLLGK
ncbi:MAG: hypothetical protein ACYS5V_11605 [Planctomycetota bacterium]|jgi:hypothetical protein